MKNVKFHGGFKDINKLIDNSFRVSVCGNGVSFPIGFDSIIYGLEMLERLYEQHLEDSGSKHFYSKDDLSRHPVDDEYFQLKKIF